MSNKKKLKDLTIKHNFMFGAVMSEPENCKGALERVLNFPIRSVSISQEKSFSYNPEFRGVRLDVFAEDENNTRYDVEMQTLKKDDLKRRSRYYHSHMDMDELLTNADYSTLTDAYVIFICDFDPFGKEKYQYSFENMCHEIPGFALKDGNHTIFLSTKGKNRKEVSKDLVKFLEYIGADPEDSERDYGDAYIKQLQSSVDRIKNSREMEAKFMQFELMLASERREGKAEGKVEGLASAVLQILSELGNVSEKLCNQIMQETDLETLNAWVKKAAKAESIEQFCEIM